MIGIRPPIVSALEVLKPKAQWTLAGDSYANLEWLDKIFRHDQSIEAEKIKEELRDLFLHIVFYSKISSEKKHFDIINKKLIISNPDFLSIIHKYKKYKTISYREA